MREMNKEPLISVIMGVYNDQRFLKEAIESILCQTYKNFEFIICNDCSADQSTKILEKYKKIDNRITIINNKKNMGLAASLNRCIDISKGDYIARMDSDDRALSDRFSIQVEYLNEHPDTSVIGTNVYYIDNSSNRYSKTEFPHMKSISLKEAVKQTSLIHPSVMMRKEAILNVNKYTVTELTCRAEDYDLWCKMKEKRMVLETIGDYLLEYREDESGIKKRKYVYRIQEAKLKFYWMKRTGMTKYLFIYALKPLIIGMIPKKIYKKLHKRRIIDV